ncbi:MAG TPA: hypothetical protein VM008_13140 [Phycisphaerae bacterium]|nr:hypothetical protein [Phycisphaerae bacterium]
MQQDAVSVSLNNGVPNVVVPKESLWSFVEFLALTRVHALFSYSGENFRVSFPNHTKEAAEQLVADWAGYVHHPPEAAPHQLANS